MKYFLVSDIHGYYTQLKEALSKAKFEKDNPEHTLVVLGDIFDRGEENEAVFNFLMSLDRCIFIRGNHELLLMELLEKKVPDAYDWSNGTVQTVLEFTGYSEDSILPDYAMRELFGLADEIESDSKRIKDNWKRIVYHFKQLPVYKFVSDLSNWKWHHEIGDYVCVHSFIPLINLDGLPGYYIRNRNLSYYPEWRNETDIRRLEDSTWGCPWRCYLDGYFDEEKQKGKVLVCGHWASLDCRKHLDPNYFLDRHSSKICYTPNFIAIDASTFSSNRVNVLIVNENGECFDEENNKLEFKKDEYVPFSTTEIPNTANNSELKEK